MRILFRFLLLGVVLGFLIYGGIRTVHLVKQAHSRASASQIGQWSPPAPTATRTTPRYSVIVDPSSPATAPSTQPPRAVTLGQGQYHATGQGITMSLTLHLKAGDAVVGQSYGFQDFSGGCQAFLIQGPVQGLTVTVTDGEYFVFLDQHLSRADMESLLAQVTSKQQRQGYGCQTTHQTRIKGEPMPAP